MPTYRTPDVIIEEVSVFPPSVAEVETAIPAFMGYTERARRTADDDLLRVPTKIVSFKEFEALFGGPETPDIAVEIDADGGVAVTPPEPTYLLYHAVKMFFDNGGGQCFIVSAGGYAADPQTEDHAGLIACLDPVAQEDEPTLLVVPEAIQLGSADYMALTSACLLQCGTLGDRFAIIDLRQGATRLLDAQAARAEISSPHLKYGAAYYPFLETTTNHAIRRDAAGQPTYENVRVSLSGAAAVGLDTLRDSDTGTFNSVRSALKEHFLRMPPSAAVAGVYASTDARRGVWKSPANVPLADVTGPSVRVDNALQDGLNVDPTSGKSINAIRAFAGKGTLVWGARTLAGNDNEWRYVSVRRFFNMIEESLKKSTYWAVFEPNDANTWVKVRGMIESYLTQKWRDGALAGATTKDAFFVRCGLGSTMAAQDILEGRMIVEIGMAVVRPAEFVILRFSHLLQTS